MTHLDVGQWYRLARASTPLQVVEIGEETVKVSTLAGQTMDIEPDGLTGPIPVAHARFKVEYDTILFLDEYTDGDEGVRDACSDIEIPEVPGILYDDSTFEVISTEHNDLEYRSVPFRLRRENKGTSKHKWAVFLNLETSPTDWIDDCDTFAEAVEATKGMIDERLG